MYNDILKDLKYTADFINKYKELEDKDKSIKEGELLKLQVPYIMSDLKANDLLCGLMEHGYVGFSPQYGGLYCYYFHEEKFLEEINKIKKYISKEFSDELLSAYEYMKKEKTLNKFNEELEKNKPENLTVGSSYEAPGLGNCDARLAGTNVDLEKLINLGLNGLVKEATKNDSEFSKGIIMGIESIKMAIDFYIQQIDDQIDTVLIARKKEMKKMREVLMKIKFSKPQTFREGLQLMWIYAVCSDLMNYGRMDRYLGNLYENDLKNGMITEDEAYKLLTDLYQKFKYVNKVHDCRVIIGGYNQSSGALKLAKLIVKVSKDIKDVVPQLTLLVNKEIDDELYDLSLEALKEKTTFPILYNQDELIKSGMKHFNVDYETAKDTIPFGCGELVLDKKSVGTPNNGINLLKAFELVFTQGYCNVHNMKVSLETKDVESITSFKELIEEYHKHLVPVVNYCAKAKKINYDIAAQNCSYLMISMLMDDCIKRDKPLLDGGVEIKGASSEIFGIISLADSLTAINNLVFKEKKLTLQQIKEAIINDFEGYEEIRFMLKQQPKYGNDIREADEMAEFVLNDISGLTREAKEYTDLDVYDIVSVNNSMSAEWGEYVLASACSRKAHTAMSNGNGASIGADQKGLTALFNSMSKFNSENHLGVINNVRINKQLIEDNYPLVKGVISGFFNSGGFQTNLCIIDNEDLIKAQKNPEQYEDLVVRIGGFSAKFVGLNKVTQNEIINRTTHA